MSRLMRMLLLTIFFCALSLPCFASMMVVSAREEMNTSDIVVAGELKNIKRGLPGLVSTDYGIIEITKVMKGEPALKSVTIAFKGKFSPWMEDESTYEKGESGVWGLIKTEKGHYRVRALFSFEVMPLIEMIHKRQPLLDMLGYLEKGTEGQKRFVMQEWELEADERVVPYVVPYLESKDSSMLNWAIFTLNRITNQVFGSEDYSPVEERDEKEKQIAKKYLEWYAQNKHLSREEWVKQGIERDVALLNNQDKEVSQNAAERLVKATGEYGFEGTSSRVPQSFEARGRWQEWWPKNKDRPRREWAKDLIKSNDSCLRDESIRLIEELVKFGDTDLLGNLSGMLSDENAWICREVNEALQRITGEDMGFSYKSGETCGAGPILDKNYPEVIKKWQAWWQENKDAFRYNP